MIKMQKISPVTFFSNPVNVTINGVDAVAVLTSKTDDGIGNVFANIRPENQKKKCWNIDFKSVADGIKYLESVYVSDFRPFLKAFEPGNVPGKRQEAQDNEENYQWIFVQHGHRPSCGRMG